MKDLCNPPPGRVHWPWQTNDLTPYKIASCLTMSATNSVKASLLEKLPIMCSSISLPRFRTVSQSWIWLGHPELYWSTPVLSKMLFYLSIIPDLLQVYLLTEDILSRLKAGSLFILHGSLTVIWMLHSFHSSKMIYVSLFDDLLFAFWLRYRALCVSII